MTPRIAQLISRCSVCLSWAMKAGIFFVSVGVLILLFELWVWPWMATNATLKRLGVSPFFSERMTLVERRETVTVTQDENFERLATEASALLVHIVELPDRPTIEPFQAAGTLVTNDGLVVTYSDKSPRANARYTAWFTSEREVPLTWVGYDPLMNLAFFRMSESNTPAVSFTNTLDLRAGRRVALLGMQSEGRIAILPTVIESWERTFNLSPQTVASSEKWEGVLGLPLAVTDAYVGGSALLMNGELAGIIGQRVLDGQATAFLLPADAVRHSLERLIANAGARPVTGLYYQSLTPEVARLMKLPRDRGALVFSPSGRTGLAVIAGSPAARAGLQFGDIIIAVNGVEINLDTPLSVALGKLSPGDTATLLVVRNGGEQEIDLSL